MLKIKICGITNREDALLAERLGADMLGFVFYPESPRFVSPVLVFEIERRLSPLTQKVGVFVNEPAGKILRMARQLKLDFVQLAGDETETYIKKIQKNLPVIKAFRVGPDFLISQVRQSPAELRLLDSRVDGSYGGSGKSFDWRRLSSLRGDVRLVLAGGIGAHNLREAYETLRPAAVDLTSSVEVRPGKKDAVKMRQFFEAANEVRLGC
ncbi:MAG: phosphoribosylanthranilate isomerase [candidate division Zixibacteria bacterium]|nr:phosphoribosylanthranilate isomerase [candidate division Zixibacteria bacterium]